MNAFAFFKANDSHGIQKDDFYGHKSVLQRLNTSYTFRILGKFENMHAKVSTQPSTLDVIGSRWLPSITIGGYLTVHLGLWWLIYGVRLIF